MIKLLLKYIPRPILIRLSYYFRPVIVFILKGKNHTDPIDGKQFSTFLPYGYTVKRPNVLSPSTLSLERHRLLWLYLKHETDFFKPKTEHLKVLHFAPEQCFLKRFRNLKHVDYTTTDLKSPIADIKADICDLPFEDNSYDVIFCNHVLEHITDDKKAMQELYRVMKPNGWGIFQVPIDTDRAETYEDDTITDKVERTRLFGQYDHVRVYGNDYYTRLADVGFKVEKNDYTGTLDASTIETYRLAKGEIIPVVRK